MPGGPIKSNKPMKGYVHKRFQSTIALMRPRGHLTNENNEDTNVIKANIQTPKSDMENPNTIDNSERSAATCLICFDNAPNAVYMECGHGGKF